MTNYTSKANPESRFYFKATFTFGHWEFKGQVRVERDFDTLEEMLEAFRVERKRRSKIARATAGTYTLELTGPGLADWRADCEGDPHGFRSRCRNDIQVKHNI
jgi:hypothetical protein